jgi:2-polyprenyl-3-methyl-5-hydroxy-6-metoxy-1,4-benzoquinol methylase
MRLFKSRTDRDWEKFGKNDPYFGVISDDKFKMSNLADENKEEFFKSGADYIDDVLSKIKLHIDPFFRPNKALDFGCGVGRLVIPLANIASGIGEAWDAHNFIGISGRIM